MTTLYSPPRLAPFGLLLAATLLGGCLTTELSSSWLVDRLRILAVRPEPAEPSPGDTVSFEALVVSPDAELELVLWIGCLADAAGVLGCELDMDLLGELEGLDPESLTPEELAELYQELQDVGLIGAEPYLPPSYSVPDDLLDGLSEEEQREGLSLFVQITAMPQGATDEDDFELAYKRVPVSMASTPNHNPQIRALLFDGVELEPDTVVEVDAGQSYELEPVLADDAVEIYEYWSESGEVEERVEEPYYSFFVQEGSIDIPFALHPYGEFSWTAPGEPSDQERSIWIIVQDRRGGMSWWSQRVLVDG